jgi:hypothetical protein
VVVAAAAYLCHNCTQYVVSTRKSTNASCTGFNVLLGRSIVEIGSNKKEASVWYEKFISSIDPQLIQPFRRYQRLTM